VFGILNLLCIFIPKIVVAWHNFAKLLYQKEGCNFLCPAVYNNTYTLEDTLVTLR